MTTMQDAVAILSPAGPVAQRLPEYEPRPEQWAMAAEVADALSDPHHTAIEAAPATGRTLAYLVPAILQADLAGSRVVVAVRSAGLRAQILERDIPLLQAVLPQEFTCVGVRDRHHYVGHRRLAAARRQAVGWASNEGTALRDIDSWARQTPTGLINDVHPLPALAVWDRVHSAFGNCMGERCPHFDRCHYQHSRRRVAHAQLLVVSHDMLLTDLRLRRRGAELLPDYEYVIVDETHELERAASRQFGLRFSAREVDRLLTALAGPAIGLLATCHTQGMIDLVEETRDVADGLFGRLADLTFPRSAAVLKGPPKVHNDLSPQFRRLADGLDGLRDQLTCEDALFELSHFIERCLGMEDAIRELLKQEREGCIYSLRHDANDCTLTATLTEPGVVLRETLFTLTASTVLTSSTLSVARDDADLRHVHTRLGMPSGSTLRLDGPSPRGPWSVTVHPRRMTPADLMSGDRPRCGRHVVVCPDGRRRRRWREHLDRNKEHDWGLARDPGNGLTVLTADELRHLDPRRDQLAAATLVGLPRDRGSNWLRWRNGILAMLQSCPAPAPIRLFDPAAADATHRAQLSELLWPARMCFTATR